MFMTKIADHNVFAPSLSESNKRVCVCVKAEKTSFDNQQSGQIIVVLQQIPTQIQQITKNTSISKSRSISSS